MPIEILIQSSSKKNCPKWKQFLFKVFDSNEELIAFVQRAVGYTLTGDVSELQQSSSGKIYRITMPMLDISATQIRNLISNNQDAHGLVPEKVLDFIHSNSLYK